MIIELIEQKILPGTIIPKPEAERDFIVKGWGKSRGAKALVYLVPNHKNPKKPGSKRINANEWEKAYQQLLDTGILTREWFNKNMPECAEDGSCNFTTIGGIFELLGLAKYNHKHSGEYLKS